MPSWHNEFYILIMVYFATVVMQHQSYHWLFILFVAFLLKNNLCRTHLQQLQWKSKTKDTFMQIMVRIDYKNIRQCQP